MSADVVVVYVSLPREEAKNMARALVENRMAACVNIIPQIESYFFWEGKAEYDEEALLIIKTSSARFDRLRDFIAEVHPYELPEIIGLPITHGLSEYVEWVKKESEEQSAE